ncbi:MAG TPA: hypothetical protein VGC89_15150 [Pyrinomonadaceae bacterium]
MKKLSRRIRVLPVAVLCLLVVGGAAAFTHRQQNRAQAARPEVKVVLSGAVERDATRLPVEKISAVMPGETLDWTITSQNEGTAPAHEYKTVGQIPKGTTFISGSATADGTASVSYSIDGGKSYSAQPTIEEKQADGSTRRVAAPASMYTQVRYEWADPLADGGQLSASYKVRVK